MFHIMQSSLHVFKHFKLGESVPLFFCFHHTLFTKRAPKHSSGNLTIVMSQRALTSLGWTSRQAKAALLETRLKRLCFPLMEESWMHKEAVRTKCCQAIKGQRHWDPEMFLALRGARLLCTITGTKMQSLPFMHQDSIATSAKNPTPRSVLSLCIWHVYFRRTINWHPVYFPVNAVVTVESNSLVHLLGSLITVDWGKHISSHSAQLARSHRHLLQTYNYGFPKHHFWKHRAWNDVREPLYSYWCSSVCLFVHVPHHSWLWFLTAAVKKVSNMTSTGVIFFFYYFIFSIL